MIIVFSPLFRLVSIIVQSMHRQIHGCYHEPVLRQSMYIFICIIHCRNIRYSETCPHFSAYRAGSAQTPLNWHLQSFSAFIIPACMTQIWIPSFGGTKKALRCWRWQCESLCLLLSINVQFQINIQFPIIPGSCACSDKFSFCGSMIVLLRLDTSVWMSAVSNANENRSAASLFPYYQHQEGAIDTSINQIVIRRLLLLKVEK